MTETESVELRHLADDLEESAGRIPAGSDWRHRFLQEARLFRAAAGLPADVPSQSRAARVYESGLRLVGSGEGVV